MSDPYLLSRRKAIALLGVSAVSMGAATRQLNASTASPPRRVRNTFLAMAR
jgi:hypothetical protein